MSRRSQRRKAISPEPIIISDEDDFVAVASDDKYVASHFCCHQSFLILLSSIALKTTLIIRTMVKILPSLLASMVPLSPLSKRRVVQLRMWNQIMSCTLLSHCFPLCFSYFCFHRTEITPPPTPSPVKATSGKKRAVANNDSDEDDVFVPR